MSGLWRDEEGGIGKALAGGAVLRVREQMYNAILTLSRSEADPVWLEGW